jgi:non-ribosomal peptide synthetase component E (peptide arylation enzyme)
MTSLSFQPDAASYYAQGYWRESDLWSDFAALAAVDPAKDALRIGERSITYGELARAAAALSAQLAASGVARGDVVILLGRNSFAAAIGFLACLHRGDRSAAAADVRRRPADRARLPDRREGAGRLRR